MLLLSVLLFSSGIAGLAYEVVWLRVAAQSLGSDASATALVLSVFMGGMALGSLALGRRVDRSREPLLWFAGCETWLAVCAVLAPLGLRAVAAVDRGLGESVSLPAATLLRALTVTAVLLPPTFCMGGTLPAIAAHLARSPLRGGQHLVTLYAIHVLGAVAGCLLSSFVAIPKFGLQGSSALGALFNLSAALLAVGLARKGAWRRALPAEEPARSASFAVASTRLAPEATAAFLSGLLLLGCEVVFVRTLVMGLSAKVHSFALMLATFLLGLGLASLLVALLPRRATGRGAVAVALAATALALRSSAVVAPRSATQGLLRSMADGTVSPGEYLALVLAVSGTTLLPVALCAGTILPLVLRGVAHAGPATEAGSRAGRILCWNTLGSVSGPLLFLFVLVPRAGLLGSLHLAAYAAALAALGFVLPRLGELRVLLPSALGAVALGAALLVDPPSFSGTPELDASLHAERELVGQAGATVLHHREGSTATVTVTERDGRPTLRLDGFEAAGAPGDSTQAYQYMRLLAHLPALLHPAEELDLGLVICCGTGTTAGSLCAHPFTRVDLVDLHPEVLECLPYFHAGNHDLAEDPRCTKTAIDGRSFLRRTRTQYDVITLEPMPPQYAGMTALYSVEFYRDCSRAMREGAVLAQWLPYHLVNAEQARAIVAAMTEVFSSAQVWEHRQTGILLARKGKDLEIDARRFEQVRQIPVVRADFDAAGIRDLPTLLDAFVCEAEDLAMDGIVPVRDDRPTLEYQVFGFGLAAASPAELAEIREPFFRARLTSRPPLRRAGDEDAPRLLRSWRADSVARYAHYLDARSDRAAAVDLLESALRDDPELAAEPAIVSIRNRFRRSRRRRVPRSFLRHGARIPLSMSHHCAVPALFRH